MNSRAPALRLRHSALRYAVFSLLLGVTGPAAAQTPAGSGAAESAPVPEARRETAAEVRAEVRPDGKKPQVRTYTSVMVVDDPTKIPRLPAPSRGPGETRENVRELRREIQELRRDLRKDSEAVGARPGGPAGPPARAAGAATGAAAGARPTPPGQDPVRSPAAEAGRSAERERPLRDAAGMRGDRPSPREREPRGGEGRPALPPPPPR